MTFEFEGRSLDRSPARRWLSIIAVVIPVATFVLGAAWFIRAYIAPPTVAIPSPMMLAAAPPASPAPLSPPVRAQADAPRAPQVVALAEPVAPPPSREPARERAESAFALPMFATLTAAPPSLATPPAYADPAQDVPPAALPEPAAEPVADELAAEPIAEPVPLPRAKPHIAAVLVANAVPLPRPRPAEIVAPESDLPVVDRHAVE
jgi:hypothetical protein